MLFAALMTAAILALPFILLPPVIDRLFGQVHLRAMVRRMFRIDSEATIVDLPEPRRPGRCARPAAPVSSPARQ